MIPANALIGGNDINGQSLYICRHQQNSDLIPGKADKHLGCVVSYAGKEVFITKSESFEVLIAKGIEWVARHGTDPIPEHALVVGTTIHGNSYVGRCYVRGSQVVGKIDYNFFYGLSGKEFKNCTNHEVLVCV